MDKIYTAEERAVMEEERKKEEELQRLRALDDAPERAIQDFMNGTLEVKKDLKAAMSLVKREDWMDEPQETWSDEQKQKYTEFKNKIRQMEEMQANMKKVAESAMKKAKNEVEKIILNCDSKLMDAFRLKLDLDMFIKSMEMLILTLRERVEERQKWREDISNYKSEVTKLSEEVDACNKSLDKSRRRSSIKEKVADKIWQDLHEYKGLYKERLTIEQALQGEMDIQLMKKLYYDNVASSPEGVPQLNGLHLDWLGQNQNK